MGANCIFPIIGICEFHWTFLASEIDQTALENAQKICTENNLSKHIKFIKQTDPKKILDGILPIDFQQYDILICNPPFYHTADERKFKMCSKIADNEESTEGGEIGFIQRIMQESQKYKTNIKWFTTLVGKKVDFEFAKRYAKNFIEDIKEFKEDTIDQGKNRRWVIAWTFIES